MKTTLAVVALALLTSFHVPSALAQTTTQLPGTRRLPVDLATCCPTVIVYQRGLADSFAAPIDPVYPSLALDAFLASALIPGYPDVAYDDASNCDHHFGDSFKLDACVLCCGICSATLEITLRGCGSGLDCNDSISVGQAPFTAGGGGGYLIWNGYINSTGCPGAGPGQPSIATSIADRASATTRQPQPQPNNVSATVVKTIQLDPRKLAELVCERHITTLDVYIQDDQIVDSMRLIITKP